MGSEGLRQVLFSVGLLKGSLYTKIHINLQEETMIINFFPKSTKVLKDISCFWEY